MAMLLAAPAIAAPTPPPPADAGDERPVLELPEDVGPLPHVRIDVEAREVEIPATVVAREAEWLELLVCPPGGREHETILTSEARPSHIHLALLMLGLEAGRPLAWEVNPEDRDDPTIHPPRGPEVEIFIVMRGEAGEQLVPVNEWVIDRETGQTLPDNRFLFTGSRIEVVDEEQRFYLADLNGTTISLVNFGDDVIVRPTTQTNVTDEQRLAANTQRIPEEGTEVTVRIRVVEEEEDEDAQGEAGAGDAAG
ncbi:MAG: YdjY domain-containing protein [Phycisphaeraceae bacterium]